MASNLRDKPRLSPKMITGKSATRAIRKGTLDALHVGRELSQRMDSAGDLETHVRRTDAKDGLKKTAAAVDKDNAAQRPQRQLHETCMRADWARRKTIQTMFTQREQHPVLPMQKLRGILKGSICHARPGGNGEKRPNARLERDACCFVPMQNITCRIVFATP